MSKFQVYKDAAKKFRFRLRASNNKIVAHGEAYEQRASCLNGVKSVQRNCDAPIQDLTVEGGPKQLNPKYQIFQDAKGKFRFHLKAANGEIIAQGEGYETKEACLNGIEVVRGSREAEIEDSTIVNNAKKDPKIIQVEESSSKTTVKIEELSSRKNLNEPAVSIPEIKPPTAPLNLETEAKVEPGLLQEKLEDTQKQTPTPTLNLEPQESYPWETKLELYAVPQALNRGTIATLHGKLTSAVSGRGVSGAKIRIYERDKSILGDDYLAFGHTNEEGSFIINWKARPVTWRKNTGNIYAKFTGNEKAKPSKSNIITISIA